MLINLQRRKAAMARSIKLGHCVCNPRQNCPCPTFKSYNLCPCAGEKRPAAAGPVPLTQFVRKAGCASKIGQADLRRILAQLPQSNNPNILLGAAAGDDAGVYRIDAQKCLVQTVDVFTPCVDDPYLFGQIAAANSLSDIYAMGGKPLTALSIVGFPIDDLDASLLEAMLQGGIQKLTEAGCSLIGGHSLVDEEIKCGFAVTGLVDSRQVVPRDNARPGDALVLTKPLGTGMISFAAQIGRATPECLREIGSVMATLNRDACELMLEYGSHACTDITGFGLMGHLVEMARNSGVVVELDLSALPVFTAAVDCLENEVLPGAIDRNQEYAGAWVRFDGRAAEAFLPLLYDPQTSGGLLISLPHAQARELVACLHARGHDAATVIGRVQALSGQHQAGEVTLVNPRLSNLFGSSRIVPPAANNDRPDAGPEPESSGNLQPAHTDACCAAVAGDRFPADAAGGATAAASNLPVSDIASPGKETTEALFAAFLKAANREGRIDQRTKKLIAISLSLAQRCQPCLAAHLESARAMGIPQAEIDEAVWLAIAFAGSPALVLYREATSRLNG
ncbi:MAG: selenide, water dikinase SelD [Candidatus Omnitrophica bacterium]|nr:selenide, water dikinase SelD [Candidatus Omnitrophota bacterium]